MIDILLFGVLWGLLLHSIQRGYRKDRRVDRFAILTWLIFVCIALLCTFRIPAIDVAINRRFDGHPVTPFLNAWFSLSAAVLYGVSLIIVHHHAEEDIPLRRYHRWIVCAAPVCGLVLVLLLAASFGGSLSQDYTFHLMRFVLALYLLLLALAMLIPINWWLFRHESVLPMRCKHLAMIVGLATYISGSLVAVVLVPIYLIQGDFYPDVGSPLRVIVGGLCMVVILVPHRWIVAAWLPLQWYRYARLAALERKIGEFVSVQREPFEWRLTLRTQYVEMMTYITVISILDNYRRIAPHHPVGRSICQQIEALLPRYPEYDDLVKAMSRVTV